MITTNITKRVFNDVSLPSYGNRTFLENLKSADKAIENVRYTERIWDRSRSQWMIKHLTCSQADVWMRLRQVSAEMSRKRQALSEAKYNYMEKITRAKIKREKMIKDTDTLQSDLLEIQASKLESQAQEILVKMEGAMKEVETLSQMHDSLRDRLGGVNEADYETAQAMAHIKRAVMQAVREVRESGTIKTGNQEYLEQCGVCVTAARLEIDKYLKQEVESGVCNTSLLHSFLDNFAEKYAPVAVVQAEWLGFDEKPDSTLMLDNENRI